MMTGDRDMYQCAIRDASASSSSSRASRGSSTVDPAEVQRRYGIAPELVPDFIALRGDPSDGLPGAPGIGAKTAADLLERHGSLEARSRTPPGSGRGSPAALTEHADDAAGVP